MQDDLASRMRVLRRLAASVSRTGVELSALELSSLAGVSKSVVNHIERGRIVHPNTDTLAAIAEVLGVSLDWVVRGVGDAPIAADVCVAVERARAHRRSSVEASDGDDAAEHTGTEG